MKRHANEGDEREREKKRSSFPFYNNYYNTIESVYSVSYTHLRAHETREDLVCRLLLEKKKEQSFSMIFLIRCIFVFTV